MNHTTITRRAFALTSIALTAFGLSSLTAAETPAAIELGAPFTDNAILQREMPLPVWGWCKPGTSITVEFAGQKETTKAGTDGKWILKLKPLTASAEPAEMLIGDSDGKKIALKNILVGEVWMASGQSNMQWLAAKCDVKEIVADLKTKGETPPIREFEVTGAYSALHPIERATGAWKDGDYGTYSAVAFAFAHKLYVELKVPVGILNCSWSQTAIESWIPRVGYTTAQDDYCKEINRKCQITDPRTPEHKAAWSAFYKSLEDQIAANDERTKKGLKASTITAPVPGNFGDNRDASWMFNGRMNPVVPFAIRGAIWNQGWANRQSGLLYYNSLHSLIRGWRMVWDMPDMPVYFHQFYCPGNEHTGKPSLDSTAEMRLGTWLARDIPNVGMACQIDIEGAIHYGNKALPGKRLALHALKNQYGKNIVADSPMFKSYEVKGDQLTISFDFANGGLLVGQAIEKELIDAPTVLENSEDKVKLFYLAGEDRVWHPATMKIDGEKVVVSSPGVKAPLGVAYGSEGIGALPNLYNQALLPLVPFIYYNNKLVTSKDWPGGKLVIANEQTDTSQDGKLYEYRKMPLLSQQFDDNAVLQAGKPVTIWGSTRKFGEWQNEPEKGDCKVEFELGDIKKTLSITPDMAEWQITLPAMSAGEKPYTLKVHFTIDGETVHERVAANIVFGDVWYLALPAGNFTGPEVKPSGQIIRMIENESKRDGAQLPSRFSISTSRGPRPDNRFGSYWKDADGLAAAFGHSIAARTKQPVGIIFMQTKTDVALKNWIPANDLNQAPSLMAEYKTIGSQYPDNPYYIENVRRYMTDWRNYWNLYIPAMIETKAAPDGAKWGIYPKAEPEIGDSQTSTTYNINVDCFSPLQARGIVFLAGNAMIADQEGANFGPEMSVLTNSFKTKMGGDEVPFYYTIPSPSLAPRITKPQSIKGPSTAMEIDQWSAAKPGAKPNDKEELAAASARISNLLDQVVKSSSVGNPVK